MRLPFESQALEIFLNVKFRRGFIWASRFSYRTRASYAEYHVWTLRLFVISLSSKY